MNFEEAKSTFLLEHCAERCDGYQKDDACENCEINVAIKALDKMTELKKCPFCGSEARLNTCSGKYFVECTHETWCEVLPKTWLYNTEKEAIEAWNRRAE